MEILKYFCDRCKYEIINKQQVWSVFVKFQPLHETYMDNARPAAHWCRTCMVEMGILGTDEEKKETPPIQPEPTLEDLIREIIREELGR